MDLSKIWICRIRFDVDRTSDSLFRWNLVYPGFELTGLESLSQWNVVLKSKNFDDQTLKLGGGFKHTVFFLKCSSLIWGNDSEMIQLYPILLFFLQMGLKPPTIGNLFWRKISGIHMNWQSRAQSIRPNIKTLGEGWTIGIIWTNYDLTRSHSKRCSAEANKHTLQKNISLDFSEIFFPTKNCVIAKDTSLCSSQRRSGPSGGKIWNARAVRIAIVGPFEHPCGPGIEYPGQRMYEGSFANKSIMMHVYVFI